MNLSFRQKIVSLLMFLMTASFASYTYVGTKLILEDKSSYIFDYSLAQVKSTSPKYEQKLSSRPLEQRQAGDFASMGLSHKDFDETQTAGGLLKVTLIHKASKNILPQTDPGLSQLLESQSQKVADLLETPFEAGSQEWIAADNNWIISYQKVDSGRFVLLAATSKDTAFSAAKLLIQKTLLLGISILCLAIGLALLLARSVLRPLYSIWDATKKVGDGNFNVLVDTARLGRDEIFELANGFNSMTKKIQELLVKTEQKARMESELETARLVQGRFFPATDFSDSGVEVSGGIVPATECSGDWWHYWKIKDELMIVIGDVTGHGASAALVTAAAFGALSVHRALGSTLEQTVIGMNESVFQAAHGSATMTLLIASVNLKTGKLRFANCSHRPPVLRRQGVWKSLVTDPLAALGESSQYNLLVSDDQLNPGDSFFIYTDGLVECALSDGSSTPIVLGNRGLRDLLTQLPEKANAAELRDLMTKRLAGSHLEDDVTWVFTKRL